MNNFFYFLRWSFFWRIVYENVYVNIFLFFNVSSLHSSPVSAIITYFNSLLTYILYLFTFTLFIHQWFFSIVLCYNCPVMMGGFRQRRISFFYSFVFDKIPNSLIILGFHLRKTISFSFVWTRSLLVSFVFWLPLFNPLWILIKRAKIKGFMPIWLILALLLF